MSNPFMDRIAARPIAAHGKLSEKKLAAKMGARPTPASGAMRGAKGDAVLARGQKRWRMEMKSTTGERLVLERHWLRKITHEAVAQEEYPALTMSFVEESGTPRDGNSTWVAVPLWVWLEMVEGKLAKS